MTGNLHERAKIGAKTGSYQWRVSPVVEMILDMKEHHKVDVACNHSEECLMKVLSPFNCNDQKINLIKVMKCQDLVPL